MLWGRDAGQLSQMAAARHNAAYLPEARFPDALRIESDLGSSMTDVRDVLICVPSHAFRQVLGEVKPHLKDGMRICWATKGFELQSGLLPHQVAAEVLGSALPMAVLSGPTFATEVGAGLPTAMTVASTDTEFAASLARIISDSTFRAYTSEDLIGVEVGGAVKNVLAIGAGISDGLGFGANTRIALITRGLVEMTRLGVALGAKKETFMGLAGIGDLVLTCTDNQSRNRRMGLALAAGKSVAEASGEIKQIVEGVYAARSVHEVAARSGVEMPICEQVHRVIYEEAPPQEAVGALMRRALKAENS